MNDAVVPVVHVCMGLHAVTRGPTLLKATLGSCVGIALVWRAQGLCALAHCLLPEAPTSHRGPGARYVDQALRTLLDEMQVPRNKHLEVEAHLCGGAHMTNDREAGDTASGWHLHVGRRNIEAAYRALALERMDLQSADLGGHCARRLIVDAANGRVTTVRVPYAPVWAGLSGGG